MMDNFLRDKKLAILYERNQIMEFTLEELAQYDGMDERPAYVAVDGIVYNVTDFPIWRRGSHFGITAGRDVSDKYHSCHAGFPILEELPVMGVLVI